VDFIKVNFDGASKGNSGTTIFRVVFRNHQRNILLIIAGSLGHTTNNAEEIWGFTRGLQLSIEHNFNKLIVEGYSQIILNLFRKVLNGVDLEKISPCWSLSHGLRTIAMLPRPSQDFIPSHVRRKAYQIAD
jgi:ribonuclease HI